MDAMLTVVPAELFFCTLLPSNITLSFGDRFPVQKFTLLVPSVCLRVIVLLVASSLNTVISFILR